MKKEVSTMFALIRCAVLGEALDEQTKKQVSENPSLLYDMARHHDLAHLLDYACKISGVVIEDEETAFKYVKQNAMSVMRYEDMNLALSNISGLFEEEKIPYIPLKGAVVRGFYPESWMRTSCDVDVLVHENDLDRAEKALVEKLGYTSKGKRDYHDISLYSSTNVHLELHFNIKENMDNVDTLLSAVWDYALPKCDGSYEYVLTNEFLMFQLVAHLYYHVAGGGCSVRNFLDLFLLENKLDFDRKTLCSMLEECKIKTFYDECIKLSNVWFSDGEYDETTLLFAKFLLGGGVYGTKINQMAADKGKKNAVCYALGRIFMPYEQLCIKYPDLKEKRYLAPVYQVRRWGEFAFRGNVKKLPQEFSANNDISSERKKDVDLLFKKLGIK